MSRAAPHWILCLFLPAAVSYGTACMEHVRCDDTLISRAASPDGTLVAAVFHRSCSGGTGLYTYARVEKPQRFFRAGGEEVCHVVTISGHHAMEAVWKDSRRLAISSPDPLGQYGISSQHESCDDIQISYDLKVEPPPPQAAPDAKVVDSIRKALTRSDECIREQSGAGVADSLYRMLDNDMHRMALELLLTNLIRDRCPVTRETYDLLREAGTAMNVGGNYWGELEPLVE